MPNSAISLLFCVCPTDEVLAEQFDLGKDRSLLIEINGRKNREKLLTDSNNRLL